MTTPESASSGSDQPGDADARPPAGLEPDRLGGSSPEETPTRPQPAVNAVPAEDEPARDPAPEPVDQPPPTTGQPAGAGSVPTGQPASGGGRSGPAWSSPATVASAPPLGGRPPEPPRETGPPDTAAAPPGGEHGPKPWMILGAAALFLLCCYGGVALAVFAFGGDVVDAVRHRTERAVAVGQPARDGDLEFRVRQVQCGISMVGDPFVNQTATGQFCVVQLDVRNLGSRPVTFTDTLQRAYGPDRQQFTADPGAGILANADRPNFLSEINPGNQVSGAIVYDIPENARIVRLRLRESPHSRGVLVRV